MTDRRLAQKEVAEMLAVSIDTILSLIATGQLRAVNVARAAGSKKPRWRVSEGDLARFENVRSNAPAPKPQRRRRRSDQPIKEYV